MPNRFHILVVDDEPVQREMIGGFLKKQGFEVIAADSAERALELFRQDAFDLVLTDQKMADMSGLELLQAVHTISRETPVILITAFGTIEAAVAALKRGAIDYLTKPLNLDELLYRIRQVSDRYRIINENRELREALQERHRIEGIIGESGPMLEVLSIVRRVAPSEATVLIRGESGTGKELIAKAIHFGSPRARGPLVKGNCAALPEALLESELFGHGKGAPMLRCCWTTSCANTRRKTARRFAGLRLKAGTFFYATTIREMSESWKILSSARWCSPGMM